MTLGALVAFVASLAIGKLVPLPGSMVLLDWVASLGTLAAVRWVLNRRAEKGVAAEIPHEPNADSEPEPEVVATFRGRVVMVALPAGRPDASGLLGRIAALKPARWIVVGGDPDQVDRLGPCVSRLAAGASASASVLREAFAAYRPSVLIDAYEPECGGEPVRALTTRRLVNAALGAGVASVVLISRGVEAASPPSLSERIMRVLSGLTRSRLIRVRLRDGASLADPATARRVLRVAAKGRDGSLVKLGPSVGSGEVVLGGRGDAAELWAELDRIEVVQGWR